MMSRICTCSTACAPVASTCACAPSGPVKVNRSFGRRMRSQATTHVDSAVHSAAESTTTRMVSSAPRVPARPADRSTPLRAPRSSSSSTSASNSECNSSTSSSEPSTASTSSMSSFPRTACAGKSATSNVVLAQ
ncbi:hypothetical protein GPX89_25095 [Nocardia sp. ET3-3]|uniref:Uncharacterized protein n=1 Tax=Nocardia terrae TaxID=2675851 RepID=A0A7K1V1I8_9NOCA|nr:hypothetical protein [Nocardia terrae]